jgi:hypothetical protein
MGFFFVYENLFEKKYYTILPETRKRELMRTQRKETAFKMAGFPASFLFFFFCARVAVD